MHIFRFFENEKFIVNNTYCLTQQNSHKIINVLRLKIDDQIYLFNNTNTEFTAKIIAINRTTRSNIVEIIILQANYKNLESDLKIHVAQAIAKHDNMDWIIQKSTELGIDQITPIITKRTIKKISNDKSKKILHWQSIATAACAQCGRNIVPTINQIMYFDDFITINQSVDMSQKFILSPAPSASIVTNNYDFSAKKIMLIIGPEGGFSDEELKFASRQKFVPLTFGPRTLRTETAAITAISILQAKYGDL